LAVEVDVASVKVEEPNDDDFDVNRSFQESEPSSSSLDLNFAGV